MKEENTMTAIEKAKRIISKRSTLNLIYDFIATGRIPDTNMPTVRGWLMDELERRNPAAFAAWLDQDCPTDESMLLYF